MRNTARSFIVSGVLLAVGAAPAYADDLPTAVQALVDQGLEIHGEFEAPSGLRGYGASMPGHEMVIYLTPDQNYALLGTLYDSEGNDLSEAHLEEHVRVSLEAEVWQLLEEGHWIQDGDTQAPRIIYTFTDPNCPYCQQLWQESRPWVEAGDVQFRHIMIGVITPDSSAKASVLLGAEDPAAALSAHKRGETAQAAAQPRAIENKVLENNQLFEDLGLYATPTSAYLRRAANGVVRLERVQGMPDTQSLQDMMEGEPVEHH